jgi:uncharacterized phage protein (TIGR01671 family)
MNEIKFRVWDNIKKEMIYNGIFDVDDEDRRYLYIALNGDLIALNEYDYGKDGLWEHGVDIRGRFEKMQYIGLQDKDGKEIYEGDIIKMEYETIIFIGYVKQKEDGEWINYKNEGNNIGVCHNKDRNIIIGDKYSNPELLGVKP